MRGSGSSAAAAAAAALIVGVVGQLPLAGAGEKLVHLIEPRAVALALDLADVGGGERERQLLRGENQVAVRKLVLTHVVVGIAGVAGRARRQRRQADLVGCRWHVVEEVEQHVVRFGRAIHRHQSLGVAYRQRHVAWKEQRGALESGERCVGVSGLRLRLAEGRIQQGQPLVLLRQRREYLYRLARTVAVHQRQRLAVTITESVLAVRDLLGVVDGHVDVARGGEDPHALADQLVALRILTSPRRKLRGTRALLGDAIGIHRVIDEHRRYIGFRESHVTRHGLEHRAHSGWIETGARQIADADAVGLPFVVAREVDLVLNRHALGSGDGTLGGLAAAAERTEHDRPDQGCDRGQALLRLIRDHARDVVLGDVRGLVRHHAGELRLRGGCENQPAIDEYEAAGHRERVDGLVLDGEIVEVLPTHRALGGEALADPVDVFVDLRILDERVLIAQLMRHHCPELVLLRLREVGGRRAPEVREIVAGGGRRQYRLRRRWWRQRDRLGWRHGLRGGNHRYCGEQSRDERDRQARGHHRT